MLSMQNSQTLAMFTLPQYVLNAKQKPKPDDTVNCSICNLESGQKLVP